MTSWIDTHCHLDAPEFSADVWAVRERAQQADVRLCVIPAVAAAHFETVRSLAHACGDGYALGIHPLFVGRATDTDLAQLDAALLRHRDDPHLLAVGEIGLDFFVPELKLARQHGLPVILHVRRSADRLLKYLRELAPPEGWRGIAHAFNGSQQQAEAFMGLGLKLGFGGAVTFDAARQIRQLAASLPLDGLVLETDSPDMPPHWLYQTAKTRAEGGAQGRNEPAELPRIAQVVADLRGISAQELALASTANALVALPRLKGLLA